jgi:uncharacterized repeat protein (TIGR01451 family)
MLAANVGASRGREVNAADNVTSLRVEPGSASVVETDLTLTASTRRVGDGAIISYIVRNAGPHPAVNVSLDINLPPGTQLIRFEGPKGIPYWQLPPTWKTSLLPPGGAAVILVHARFPAAPLHVIDASVSALNEQATHNNRAVVVVGDERRRPTVQVQ